MSFNQKNVLQSSSISSQKKLTVNKCSNVLIIKFDCDDEQIDEQIDQQVEDEKEGDEGDEAGDEKEDSDKKPQKSGRGLFKESNSDIIKKTGFSREELAQMPLFEIRKKFIRKTEIYNYVLKVRRRSKNCKYAVKSRLSKKNKK
jgi:hypothetical protein